MNPTIFTLLLVSTLIFVSCQDTREKSVENIYDYSLFENQLATKNFKSLSDALGNGKISSSNYLDWTFNFQTRNKDGVELLNEFEDAVFTRANNDTNYLKSVSAFYSTWPSAASDLKKHPHPGAAKIADVLSRKR
mgnify:CR=1 FL=1|jgi:hypothetical protein